MSARFLKVFGVVMLLAALFLPMRTALAAPGGPAEATAPPSEWVEIMPGEYHWYRIDFKYDSKADVRGTDEDGKPQLGGMRDVEVKFFTQPAEGATLTVRTADQARLWERDGTQEHVGCAVTREWLKTHDDEKEMRANEGKSEKNHVHTSRTATEHAAYATWCSHLVESGAYYLVVEHARNMSEPVAYKIEVVGDGVSFPAVAAAPAAAPAVAAVPAAPVEVVAVEGTAHTPADGPDFATAPPADWTQVNAGEYLWYAFGYDGKEHKTPIQVKIWSDPAGAAMLTVRSAAEADLWRKTGAQESFGQCTCANLPVTHDDEKEMRANEGKNEKDHVHVANDATTPAKFGNWTGTPAERGVYYLVVEHARNVSGPVMFRIELQGEGVTPGM
jgi:hypothetical protein